jgi:hypothetical protein
MVKLVFPRRALAVVALLASMAVVNPGSATASIAGPATVLPNALSYEYIGIPYAYAFTSVLGTLATSGQPGCGGVCSATTTLGADPTVSATVNEVEINNTAGGLVTADLAYFVEYVNAPGTYAIDFHAPDTLHTSGGQLVSTHLQFGQAGTATSDFNDFNTIDLEERDCLNGCPSSYNTATPAPFLATNVVQMVANTLYEVEIGVYIAPGPLGVQIGGWIDPTFSDPTSTGTFIFSPGVGAAVPEPDVWVMMLFGIGLAGAAIRNTRRKPVGTSTVASA